MILKLTIAFMFIFISQFSVNLQQCGKNVFDSKFKKSTGLVHYFPFYYNTHDVISEFDLKEGSNVSLTFGRPNKLSSYLNIRSGYYKFRPTQAMNNDFSVLLWAKVNSKQDWQRVIDFGNGALSNNIVCSLAVGPTLTPAFQYYIGSNITFFLISSIELQLNTWHYLAYVLSYPTAYIYIDGQLTGSMNIIGRQLSITRNNSYIGRSNWMNDADVDAAFDELKIFNRSLTRDEVLFEMNNEIFL